ncbi:MAG TPA: MarR family transcriptional regulator [Geminicoccaceae bacterium]|nr:MarR family transcriptional regulator [Geminicoccaceae bacterium]
MDPREAFALDLGRVSRRWRARLDERLKVTGLTQARWSTLLHLSRAGECLTQRELAARVGIEGPTLVRLLDALEAQGLIERLPVEGDRRANSIRLTEAAQPLLAEINRIAADLRREILAGVPVEDLETCQRVLRHIGDRLERS